MRFTFEAGIGMYILSTWAPGLRSMPEGVFGGFGLAFYQDMRVLLLLGGVRDHVVLDEVWDIGSPLPSPGYMLFAFLHMRTTTDSTHSAFVFDI